MAKLSGVLPGKDRNGLAAIESDLVNDLHEGKRRIVIAVTDVKAVTEDADSQTKEATVRVRGIFPVADADEAAVKKLLLKSIKATADGADSDGLFEVDNAPQWLDELLYSTNTPSDDAEYDA